MVALLLLVAGWFHYHVLAGLGSLASPDFNLRNLFTLNWEASDVGICVPRNGWALMVLGCRLRCLQGPGEDNVFNHLGVLRTYSGTVLVSTGSELSSRGALTS